MANAYVWAQERKADAMRGGTHGTGAALKARLEAKHG